MKRFLHFLHAKVLAAPWKWVSSWFLSSALEENDRLQDLQWNAEVFIVLFPLETAEVKVEPPLHWFPALCVWSILGLVKERLQSLQAIPSFFELWMWGLRSLTTLGVSSSSSSTSEKAQSFSCSCRLALLVKLLLQDLHLKLSRLQFTKHAHSLIISLTLRKSWRNKYFHSLKHQNNK